MEERDDSAGLPDLVRETRAAAGELDRIRSALREVAGNYVARLDNELVAIQGRMVAQARRRRPGRRIREDIAGVARMARALDVTPHKGRRRDMKRIDALIGALQEIVDKW